MDVRGQQVRPQLAERHPGLLQAERLVQTQALPGDQGDPQDEAVASYAGFMEEDYRYVDWDRPAREVHNQVRVWRSHPPAEVPKGAIAMIDGERVRVLRTRLTPGEGREVQCGDGPIWVVETAPAD